MRFYSTEHGDLLIDGNPIQTLDMNWLRNNVTLVQQQSVLFNETIFKNIAFGRRDHSRVRKEDVKGAIEVATLQHTISDLPLGLDTVVGTGGNAMSGGQKQRVALARARLRDTPILILDEATSALDHMSKMSVVDAIRKWRNGKTTLIITHDMEQIQEGDYVYVLDKGNIVQEGFKHTFEKTALGPSRNLSTAAINMKPRRRIFPKRTLSSESIFSLISPTSDASEDPLDIEIKPRKTLIPSVFGQQPEDKFQHTPRELPSPFSPAGFPMHRGSVATWSPKLRQRDLAKLSEIPEPVSPPWTQDLRAVEMTERSTKNASRLDTTVQQGRNAQIIQSPIGPPTRSISSTALTIERTKTSWKRKPTRADKARHIAPLKKILMTIWPALTWSRRGILILGFFCAAIHAAATPTFSWVFSKLLATFYLTDHHGRSRIALKWSLTVLGIATVDSLAAYFMHYLLERCGQAWVDALRAEALKRVLDQPRSWFERDKNSLTRLTECLDRNAEEMRNLLGRFAGFVFVAITMMSIAVIWSLILSWKLTLVGLASAPFMYTVTRSFELISGRWETKSDKAASSANAIFIETFSNIRTVRVLTLESYFHNKYAKAVSETFKVGLRRSAYSGFFFGLSDSGIIFVTALIFYYGAVLASSKEYSTQDILTVFTMLLFSIANANAIIAFVPQINSSRSTATQLLRLAHLPSEASHEHTGHIRLSHPGPMVFKDTAFSYPTRPTFPVLSRLNLTIKPGTSTALVGASGCGKSTIASLLLGLYPLNSGTLSFNGVSMNDIHLPTLRSLTSIVPQQPILFATTVAHNIAYALPESSPFCNLDSIRSAARAAGIDDFICTLPLGYDTLIGDGGTGLSGGQAQRIAIARAVVRKPKLLILDEATSGLDGETARGVRDMMKNLERQGVGVIVVTHERAMMEGCTEIVVLKDGAVAEKGRFRELLLRGGELTRLLGGGGEGR